MFYLTILAQESSGTLGVLGPTKIYLAVQPPDNQPPVIQTSAAMPTTTAQTVSKPNSTIQPSVPVLNNVSECSTQVKTSEQVIKSIKNKIYN